jgi:hypothetical protein
LFPFIGARRASAVGARTVRKWRRGWPGSLTAGQATCHIPKSDISD